MDNTLKTCSNCAYFKDGFCYNLNLVDWRKPSKPDNNCSNHHNKEDAEKAWNNLKRNLIPKHFA